MFIINAGLTSMMSRCRSTSRAFVVYIAWHESAQSGIRPAVSVSVDNNWEMWSALESECEMMPAPTWIPMMRPRPLSLFPFLILASLSLSLSSFPFAKMNFSGASLAATQEISGWESRRFSGKQKFSNYYAQRLSRFTRLQIEILHDSISLITKRSGRLM